MLLSLLAVLLIAAFGLGATGWLHLTGRGGTEWGLPTFGFALGLFFITAVACVFYPAERFHLILGASLLQLLVFLGPIKWAAALALYTGFYILVHLNASWWLKAPVLGLLLVSPCLVWVIRPGSRLLGLTVTALFTGNFVLRSVLYAYEATTRPELFRRSGYRGFLLYLLAAPLTTVKAEPIGFLVLQRGLKDHLDVPLFQKGVKQMAHGFLYLFLHMLLQRKGLLPDAQSLAAAADELNVLTVLTASHLELLSLFLKVAGHIHVAIGMMRVLGFDISSGMDRPYESRSVLELWKRWNTYYRDFLMSLAYYPVVMALKRRPYLAIALGGALTFLLSGFSHALYILLPNMEAASWSGFLRRHYLFLAQGFLVVIWMLITARSRRTPRAGKTAEEGRGALAWKRLFVPASVAVTLTVTGLNLILFSPGHGFPDPAAFKILAALARPPWR